MRYWDASALVPLIVSEPNTALAHSWLEEHSVILTWAWSRVEIVSAVERRTRDGDLSRQQRRDILRRLDTFSTTWNEVSEMPAVRSLANLVLARNSLRAADAAQLGAALHVQQQLDASLPFVSLDRRLAEAAELEGLPIITT